MPGHTRHHVWHSPACNPLIHPAWHDAGQHPALRTAIRVKSCRLMAILLILYMYKFAYTHSIQSNQLFTSITLEIQFKVLIQFGLTLCLWLNNTSAVDSPLLYSTYKCLSTYRSPCVQYGKLLTPEPGNLARPPPNLRKHLSLPIGRPARSGRCLECEYFAVFLPAWRECVS